MTPDQARERLLECEARRDAAVLHSVAWTEAQQAVLCWQAVLRQAALADAAHRTPRKDP